MSDLMLKVSALDSAASVKLSRYTQKWHVSTVIEVGNGVTLTGISEHRDTPEAAVDAFFARLITLGAGEYVVSRYMGHRREWRWNGAASAECTRPEVFEREAADAATKQIAALSATHRAVSS